MKHLACHVDWMLRWANSPVIKILIDKFPDSKTLRFTKKENFYLAMKGDYARFFFYEQPGEGFGGSHFELTMEDGTTETLVGPWSSNEGAINTAFGTELVNVSLTDEVNTFLKKGGCYCSGAVSLKFVLSALTRFKCDAALAMVQDKYGSFHLQKTGTVDDPPAINEPCRELPLVLRIGDEDRRTPEGALDDVQSSIVRR